MTFILMTWSHRINLVGFYFPGFVKERVAQLNKDAGVKDQPTASSPRQIIQLDTENGLKKEAELLNVVFSASVTQNTHNKTNKNFIPNLKLFFQIIMSS